MKNYNQPLSGSSHSKGRSRLVTGRICALVLPILLFQTVGIAQTVASSTPRTAVPHAMITGYRLNELYNYYNALPVRSQPSQGIAGAQAYNAGLAATPATATLVTTTPYVTATTVNGHAMGAYLMTSLNLAACGGASGWNQADCGDCWVWAATATASAAFKPVYGNAQLFSTQWFESNFAQQTGHTVCEGLGGLSFSAWYNQSKKFIPWTNTNAGCTPGYGVNQALPVSSISQTPCWPIDGLTEYTVATTGIPLSQAITNIKSHLDAGRALQMVIWFPSQEAVNNFQTFWNTSDQNTPWPNAQNYSAFPYVGHVACVVGYDNTNNSWVVLNSWGTTSTRPNGYFEIPQAATQAIFSFSAMDVSWPCKPISEWPGCSLTFTTTPTALGGETFSNYVWHDANGQSHSFTGTSRTVGHRNYHADEEITYTITRLTATSTDGQWVLVSDLGGDGMIQRAQ